MADDNTTQDGRAAQDGRGIADDDGVAVLDRTTNEGRISRGSTPPSDTPTSLSSFDANSRTAASVNGANG